MQNATIILAVLTAVVGMGVGLRWVALPSASQRQPSGTLAEALAALDADDREQARSIAADLRLVDDLSESEAGGPAYVLGVAMARDAEEQWSEGERRIRFLLAARYLEEAKETGFPSGRAGHGLFVLGKALHDAGRYALSLPVLHEALDVDFSRRTAILGLIANAYLRDTTPRYDKALEYNREYLADDALSFDDRYDALMTQGEIMFGAGEFVNCEATISAIPESSPHFATALLLKSRLLLREGDRLTQQTGDTAAAQAVQRFESARALLDRAQVHNPTSRTLARQAQYLTGLAYRKAASLRPTAAEESVDLRAALEQFGRTRRSHSDTAEGISASLEESEIHQLFGEDDAALKAFQRTLRLVADMPVYRNPWISQQEMKDRVEAAYIAYREASQFDNATQLAAAMTPLFSASHAIQLQAEAREAAAAQLAADAQSLPLAQAQQRVVDARTEHRKAGALYARLAKLRFATRSYPDDLWKSAENYQRGQDYERAVRYYTRYLASQNRAGRPPALTALGESILALHKPEEALPFLMECIQGYPRDPHSFRARLIAAKAHQELGNLGQARMLLETNLENESLNPRGLEWRESLFALGEIFYLEGAQQETQSRLAGLANDESATRKKVIKHLENAQKSFHNAIARLAEAVERDPNARQAIEARYRIAEAYRQAAKLPRRKLEYVEVDATRKKLTGELNDELRAAEAGYQELITLLDSKRERSELSGIEQRILRNCCFARADALFDMQRYEDAIKAYENATNRYHQEPASLEAYVQIANCHRRNNQPDKFQGTLERAKINLQLIPPDADFLQTTRYDRDKWGEYLNWLGTL